VSNESPVSQAPNQVKLISATVSHSTLLSSSPCRQHTRNTTFTKNHLFTILWEDEPNVQECLRMVKWGLQRVVSEPPRAPGYYSYFGTFYHCILKLLFHVYLFSLNRHYWPSSRTTIFVVVSLHNAVRCRDLAPHTHTHTHTHTDAAGL